MLSSRVFKVEDCQKYYFRTVKRDRTEILSAIIALAQEPTPFTRLMQDANLSCLLLRKFLRFAIHAGLITKRGSDEGTNRNRTVYQATEKGNRFLKLYCEQLILLHGQHFLEINSAAADSYIIQYCRKNKLNPEYKIASTAGAETIEDT